MDVTLPPNSTLLFRCRSGSHAYGLSTSASDLDLRGVFAGSRARAYLSPPEPEFLKGVGDTEYNELSRFVRLLVDQAAPILELPWLSGDDILYQSRIWQLLREARGDLLSKRLASSFGGFARREMQSLDKRQRWHGSDAPVVPPLQSDHFSIRLGLADGLDTVPKSGNWQAVRIDRDSFVLFEGGTSALWNADRTLKISDRRLSGERGYPHHRPAAVIHFDRESFDRRVADHASYRTWLAERNSKRAEVEANIGFDPKKASHIIRILRMGTEALRDGILVVRRPDAAELLDVKLGRVSRQAFEEMYAEADASLGAALAASSLPPDVDRVMVAELVRAMYEAAWHQPSVQVRAPEDAREGAGPPEPRGRVVVVDVEGTGMPRGPDGQVVEVAAVEVVGGMRTGRVYHTHVNPGGRVGKHAIALHGLTRRFLREKPTFGSIAPDLLRFIGDSPIVAHNAQSDMSAMNHDLRRAGLEPIMHSRFHCSERMAARIFGVRLSLDSLCDVLDIPRDSRSRGHGALIDADLLADCWLAMARLPAYPHLRGTSVNPRRIEFRRVRKEQGLIKEQVKASIDAGRVAFELPDGRVTSCPLPVYPDDTHELKVSKNALLVVRGNHGDGSFVVDNPEGPAILKADEKGRIRQFFVRDGAKAGSQPVESSNEVVAGPR